MNSFEKKYEKALDISCKACMFQLKAKVEKQILNFFQSANARLLNLSSAPGTEDASLFSIFVTEHQIGKTRLKDNFQSSSAAKNY